MRESFVVFLWISAQDGEYEKSLNDVEELGTIREMWRLYRYYDYFNYGCESLLSAVLQALENVDGSTPPDQLLNLIVSKDEFTRTISATLEGVEVEEMGDQDSLDAAFQYLYYGKPTGYNSSINLNLGNDTESFRGTWSDMLDEVEKKVDPGFDPHSEPTEWKMKRLIDQEITSPTSIESSSRVFAYASVLFALLKLRHKRVFSKDEYRDYWEWFINFETKPPGPVSILDSLNSSNSTVDSFMKEIADTWAIKRYDEALYQKMDSSRMPLLYSKDFTGEIEYKGYYSARLSHIKFNRLIDILYELGLVTEPDTDSFSITPKGEEVLENMGVPQ
jgi:hypothetical protein